METVHSSDESKPEVGDKTNPALDERAITLLNLHIAEYQSLTMRNTYWITMQYALWPILLLILAFGAQIYWAFDPRILPWAIALLVQVMIVAFFTSMVEQYTNVRYLERRLRPRVQALIGETSFWEYEKHNRGGGGYHPWWTEYWPLGLGIVAISLAVIARCRPSIQSPWGILDYVSLVIDTLFWLLAIRLARISWKVLADIVAAR
jgi:hypothetical protein